MKPTSVCTLRTSGIERFPLLPVSCTSRFFTLHNRIEEIERNERAGGGLKSPDQLFSDILYRGRILGSNWNKSLKSVSPCSSQPPLPTDFTPSPTPLCKSDLKLVCNVNIVYGNLKSETSQDYAQKPQRNCTFMNSASAFF
jgi:hypothetical protein